ncbi:DUF4190 domain-containing protein [Clostridium saccharoperbutylacetonicum]
MQNLIRIFSKKNNGLAVASLVFGIISLVLCWVLIYSIITSITGIILGIISIVQKRDGFKIALAGLVTSIIGLLLSILFSAIVILGFFMY